MTLGTYICKSVTNLCPFLTMCTGPYHEQANWWLEKNRLRGENHGENEYPLRQQTQPASYIVSVKPSYVITYIIVVVPIPTDSKFPNLRSWSTNIMLFRNVSTALKSWKVRSVWMMESGWKISTLAAALRISFFLSGKYSLSEESSSRPQSTFRIALWNTIAITVSGENHLCACAYLTHFPTIFFKWQQKTFLVFNLISVLSLSWRAAFLLQIWII